MAGPGRTPKPKHMLARPSSRRSKGPEYTGPAIEEMPPLRHPNGEDWHAQTVVWWTAIWSGPSASEYLPSDVDGLMRLAMLIDEFWHEPSVKLSAEIRLQEARFGLDPIARRRLQVEVRRSEGGQSERVARRRTERDPRLDLGKLELVKQPRGKTSGS